MGKEIERKFLVKPGFRASLPEAVNIVQGYFSVDPLRTVRLRIFNEKALLTVKSMAGSMNLARYEWEIEVPIAMAREMMDICLPQRITKSRYSIPWGNHTFEVDVFHGKHEGLVIAEIELDSEGEQFEKPDWLGDEVTGNPDYYNSNLV
ncbi:MAG TPA: CYTH domain-containing protein [Bacteroidales bacterium]|jgi:adenylate cyclase|nr:CYTH domain-containing protein [Bacteroidales bacterium]HNR41278.1 CYTH domain-containing protein [Bacteroidales bacterium]HPM17338.1 CYTH domain-containing protein [Bacteroidales bacterium]HQG78036.1 CYTH domain-containing protein [Bacteroidales bacterium]